MNSEDAAKPPQTTESHAAAHVTEAQRLLRTLRERLDRHPELEQAIEQLEMALAKLAVRTGGLL
jgi:hypothetical protein